MDELKTDKGDVECKSKITLGKACFGGSAGQFCFRDTGGQKCQTSWYLEKTCLETALSNYPFDGSGRKWRDYYFAINLTLLKFPRYNSQIIEVARWIFYVVQFKGFVVRRDVFSRPCP